MNGNWIHETYRVSLERDKQWTDDFPDSVRQQILVVLIIE